MTDNAQPSAPVNLPPGTPPPNEPLAPKPPPSDDDDDDAPGPVGDEPSGP